MDSILVTGNGPLNGQIPIAGAKNACLTLMPATLLSEEPLTLTNAPRLSDIKTMITLLQSLGAEAQLLQGGKVIALASHDVANLTAHYDIVRKMRASILVLGPLLARFGHAVVSLPGGCAIGARPVDLHLKALEALGAEMELREGQQRWGQLRWGCLSHFRPNHLGRRRQKAPESGGGGLLFSWCAV